MADTKWYMNFASYAPQPTVFKNIDIKEIIDIMNEKGYYVDNFNLLSIIDPKNRSLPQFVRSTTEIEPSNIYLSKDSKSINNSNKPSGWDIYYVNGKQILSLSREKMKEIVSRYNTVKDGKDGDSDISTFHNYLVETQLNIWRSLRDWIIKK